MSQDLRRERETNSVPWYAVGTEVSAIRGNPRDPNILYSGNDPIGTLTSGAWVDRTVLAFKDAKYFRDLATSQAARLAELVAELDAANAKVAEADEALEQARRDAGSDGTVDRIREWSDRREATVAARASEAISAAPDGFNDLGAIESRAAKLRRAQSDGKLLHELRQLLETPEPSVRYWRRGRLIYRIVASGHPELWTTAGQRWTGSLEFSSAAMLEVSNETHEITAAELPAGVTP